MSCFQNGSSSLSNKKNKSKNLKILVCLQNLSKFQRNNLDQDPNPDPFVSSADPGCGSASTSKLNRSAKHCFKLGGDFSRKIIGEGKLRKL